MTTPIATQTPDRETTIRESEAFFRSVFEQSADALLLLENGVFTYCNQAAVTMMRAKDKEQFLSLHPSKLSPERQPDGRLSSEKADEMIRIALERGSHRFNWVHRRVDGSDFPVEVLLTPITLNGRQVIHTVWRDISERMKVEDALRESEARYSAVVTQAKDGIVIIQDNLLKFVNQAMADMLGYTPAEMENSPLIDYIAPEGKTLVIERIQARLAGQEVPTTYEARLQRKDGTAIDAELSAGVIEYLGKPADVGLVRDISARKKAEQTIAEQKAFLQRVIDADPNFIFVKDRDSRFVLVNQALANAYGTTIEGLLGKSDADFNPNKEEVEKFHLDDLEVIDGLQEKFIPEEQITTAAGEVRWLQTIKRPLLEADGTARLLLGVAANITERKRAENAVQESRRLLQLVMDNIPQAVFWKDKNLVYLGCNQAFAEDAGLDSPEQIIGKTDYDMPWKAEAELYRADDQKVMESGQPKLNFEEPQTTPTGDTIWLRTSKMPMVDAQGNVFAVLGMYEDITERKRLEQQIQTVMERRGYQVQVSTEISQEISQAAALDELFERVVTLTKERLGYYHTQLLRYDPTQDAVVLIAGYGETGAKMLEMGHRMEMGRGLIGTAAASGQIMMRPVLADDPDWQPNPLLPETKGEIAVPIKLGEQVLGVLDVQSDRAGAITDDDRLLLEGLCGQIAVAIEQTRLRQEMEERLQELNRLYRAMRHEGWQAFYETLDISTGYMFDRGEVRPVKELGLAEQLFAPIPVALPGGEVLGKLAVAHDAHQPLTPDDQIFLEQVAEQVALALESARLFEQTQSALYESKEAQKLIRNVIDSTDDWIFVKDREHRYQLVNQGYANALHISVEDFIGKNDLELGFPEELVKGNPEKGIRGFWADDNLVFETGMPQRFPDDIATVDGQLRIFDTIKIPLRDASNNVWGVLAFARDLTERKLAEETVAKRATQLEAVATVSTTASTVLDPDKLLQAVVDLTKQRFGLYHAHIYLIDDAQETLLLACGAGEVGQQMAAEGWSISLNHDKSIVAQAARNRQSVVANDVVHEKDSPYLSNRLLPNTRSEMAIPMVVGDKLLGVFDVQSDQPNQFTQEDANIYTTLAAQVAIALQNARLYQEQAATVTQLRELDRLKSSFLANMSHELRTPLNSILGFADVMLEGLDGPLTENMNNDLQLIQKNGQHLLHLINDVLDMAKIEAGRMNLSPETFRFHEILEEVTSITSPLASEKSLSLFIENDSDQEVEIFADRTRIRQVMLNLVNNAMKFTEKGKISMRTVRTENGILVTVRDTGIGIPPDKLEAIFQEFTQVDSSSTRKAGGTGLGLPISRKLVEMHGGRLWAESSGIPGEGSTFYVELPLEAQITDLVEKQEK